MGVGGTVSVSPQLIMAESRQTYCHGAAACSQVLALNLPDCPESAGPGHRSTRKGSGGLQEVMVVIQSGTS